MEDNYLIEDTEYTGGKSGEEDPILVAQRYLNIFHQIHIFNTAKKEEFDKSLLEMPEKIKELMITLPGGRILLEHLHDIEEKLGYNTLNTRRLITQETPTEKNKQSIQSVANKQSTGVIAAGEISLGANFAENLANSLALAFKNNQLMQNNNMEEISKILSRSFNAYASNMQHLTENLVQSAQQISTQQVSRTATVQQTAPAPEILPQQTSSTAAQLNTQNNNANSTTINNNISMDSSLFNSLNQTLAQNDEKRHADFVQIVDALNKNLESINQISQMNATALSQIKTTPILQTAPVPAPAPVATAPQLTAEAFEIPALAIANSVTEALKVNNAQQIEAIKAFGEILVEALVQSQQELAQTIVQSAPKHTVRVVVSQDVEVENQSSDTAPTANAAPVSPSFSKNDNKNENAKKEKSNFMKSFSDKISKTTNKLAQNISGTQSQQPSQESFLSKINKGLDKINELKKSDKDKGNKQNKPAEQTAKPTNKTPPKAENKQEQQTKKPNTVAEKKQPTVAQQHNQPVSPKKKEKNNAVPPAVSEKEEKTADNTIDDILANLPDDEPSILSPATADDADSLLKNINEPLLTPDTPQTQPDSNINLSENTASTQPNDVFVPTNVTQFQPDDIQPQTESKPEDKPESKPENTEPQAATISSQPAPEVETTPTAPLKSEPQDTDMHTTAQSNNLLNPTPLSEKDTSPQPTETSSISAPTTNQHQSHVVSGAYTEALNKIKDALNSDEAVTLNDIDVQPVSLGEETETELPPIYESNLQEEVEDEISLDDDNVFDSIFANNNTDDDGEWEYVDENGNPVPADDSNEWEYVDENGNPVSADDGEWEYVDENGNPVSADDGEWEYVDENGNPISNSETPTQKE